MLEFLQYTFMQRAFISGILIAMLCAVIGVFLVLRRMALIGDGLAHISFGGIAAGVFFGIYPLLSALAFSVFAALGIQKLKQMKVYSDSAIAIFFSFGLALGVVLVSLSHGFNMDLMSYLFGSILAVSETDILLILGVGLATLAALALFYKELFYITFDEESARASGVPVERLNSILLVLTAVAVVLSMRVVGILLVSSFIVIPASIALPLCRSFRQSILASVLVSVSSVVVGLLLAYYFDLAAGGAIVLVLVAAFAAMLVYKKINSK
ncbi:MAG: metal ABC transporter permease [Candidatus Micrarchaeota archaeon]|nr:metal ABC transporter permease [Candidatus Micrarchaeota archaeon]